MYFSLEGHRDFQHAYIMNSYVSRNVNLYRSKDFWINLINAQNQ